MIQATISAAVAESGMMPFMLPLAAGIALGLLACGVFALMERKKPPLKVALRSLLVGLIMGVAAGLITLQAVSYF